jgi:hypothetical protein
VNPLIPLIRMSNDIARFLGAVPTRKTAFGIDLFDPVTEVFVWTFQGERLVMPKLILWM